MAFPKPVRGAALLERKERRAQLVKHEQAEMKAAKVRDGGLCRRPRCPHCRNRKDVLPIDACHERTSHRRLGGNPAGDRTARDKIIGLCRVSHGEYDRGDLDIVPQQPAHWFAAPCDWFVRHPVSGRMIHVASESRIGVSETRGR